MSTPPSNTTIQPYLNFDGRCDEAIELYKKALGAEVVFLLRFKDSPEPPQPGCATPGMEQKVMHANLRIGDTTVLLSDGRCGGKAEFKGMNLSLIAKNEDEAKERFAALADGGEVQMPMAKTFFSPAFGMVQDRFGVGWMVLVQ